uniref:Ig-like domain-containing protein n=1 Tax=Mastacembelus armatus TaxID=205130 RepID=A0A3Q3LNE5_9TELE
LSSGLHSVCGSWSRPLEVSSVVLKLKCGQKKSLTRHRVFCLCCGVTHSSENRTVEWTRPGLDPDYVFVYRNKKFDPTNQHPSFKERVELKDSQMKDGDVSVTLKNVTFTDTGIYECRVAQGQTKAPELINITHLRVSAGECVFITTLR